MIQEIPSLAERIQIVGKRIGNTPCVPLEHDKVDLYAKLEYYNFIGSIKDRAAFSILKAGLESGEITEDTTIIEASSGNFALSVSAICHMLGLKFIAVIDPGINQIYEQLLRFFSHDVIMVTRRDEYEGYLWTKLRVVQDYCETHSNAFWTNQYENINNFNAHYNGTGVEICNSFDQLDYLFLAVASGGTISGVSQRVKSHFPNVKVVAVDADGSVIFGGKAKKRYIPGMGSGMVPPLIHKALIDEVVTVKESDTLLACRTLLRQHGLFVGGSSGTVYHAIDNYFKDKTFETKPKVAFICPDRGIGYASNVYNNQWMAEFAQKQA